MSRFISNRNSDGLTDENGHFRLPLKVLDGNILEGFEVQPTANPSMGVVITAGDAKIPYSDYSYAVWSDAPETITVPTSSTTNPRIDRVVAYVDRSMSFAADTVNHPDGLKFVVVAGTPSANPLAPTDAQVQSAIGAGNPFIDLGQISVPLGATIITSNNISVGGRTSLGLASNVKNSNLSTVNGDNIQFAIINDGEALPAPIADTTLVVLVAKR